jgi:divalent metal cation (Fe/Co/Zn/Cd) transporter
VLIVVSLFVAIRIKSLLVGRSAEPDLRAQIERIIEADPAIERLLNMITIQVGASVMLAVKVHMKGNITIEQAVDRINLLEKKLKAEAPSVGWCFVEPDCRD